MQYICVRVYAGCAIVPDSNGHVDIPSTWTSIGYKAFQSCRSLTTITIPDSVKTIGSYAFSNACLLTVAIPDSVTELEDYAFYANTDLKSVTL